ncbi:MAG: UvrD-helicase domain-containing protein [candidate division WOR-3 bacterium]
MPNVIKSRVVFAPAGSGKTEQLSERYIELLQCGVSPERILTLTFTDKAAAEMKDRILRRLAERDQALFRRVRDNTLKLRISTIHSFCLSLVRRFADLLGLDPRLEVVADPDTAWVSAKHDALVRVAENGEASKHYRPLLDLVTRDHAQGWQKLSSLLDRLFDKRALIHRAQPVPADTSQLAAAADRLRSHPLTLGRLAQHEIIFPSAMDSSSIDAAYRQLEVHRDVFMTKDGTSRIGRCKQEERVWNSLMTDYYKLLRTARFRQDFCRQFELFRSCFLAAYEQTKRTLGQVDYNDMELFALRLLEEEPEWQNILRAFDEHTDHLLIDEFQDTSLLQWRIIDKLTEEWRSGEGAKTDLGISPSIFIVGDEKQSIYLFRGANVDLFTTAADRLETWLGSDRIERVRLEDNYRSLPAIIDFNNALFSRLMAPAAENSARKQNSSSNAPPWRTRYTPFKCQRANTATGTVEIILDHLDKPSPERRERDASNVARRILSIISELQVYDRCSDGSESPRPCEYRDIAVLIRRRTHLAALEKAFRSASIPFIVVGGTGFYSEEEVRYLRYAAGFLIDPHDDLSLYLTLRGPFFSVEERDLLLANQSSGLSLWERIQNCAQSSPLTEAVRTLTDWLKRMRYETLSAVLEDAITERKLWQIFWEPQREANLRKLLTIIQNLELTGNHPLRILSLFEEDKKDEPKADVRAEGQNAVQIITIHAAKGLQFPVVFCPGIDEEILSAHPGQVEPVIDDSPERDSVLVSYLPEKDARNQDSIYQTHSKKEYEEEKRIFYVACTRARDALFLSGIWHDKVKHDTRLAWLIEALGLHEENGGFALSCQLEGVRCLPAAAIPARTLAVSQPEEPRVPIRIYPVTINPSLRVESVTRNTPGDLHRHSSEHIGLGEVIHRLLEAISSGRLMPSEPDLASETQRLLRLTGLDDTRFKDEIVTLVTGLKSTPVWEIVRPRPDAFAELPVMYVDGKTVFSGRIDRLVLRENEVLIYDYKTFPVSHDQVPVLQEEYHSRQLIHYARACQHLYPGRSIITHLVFTSLPEIIRTGTFPASTGAPGQPADN